MEDTSIQAPVAVDPEEQELSPVEGSETPDYQAKAKAFYAQLKEEKTKRKELEEKVAKLTPEKKEETPDIPVMQALSLRSEGYSDAEILTLHSYATSMHKSIAEVAKDPFIKTGIEAQRQKSKDEASIPTPSNRVGSISSKAFMDMKPEERAKEWAKKNANVK